MKYLNIKKLNNSKLEKILEEIDKQWGIEFIILGGSRGLELFNENSDWDLTIYLKDFDKIYLFTKRFKEELKLDLSFVNLKYIFDHLRSDMIFKNLTYLINNMIDEDKILYRDSKWTF